MPLPADNTPNLIVQRIVEGLRFQFQMGEAQCYPAIQEAYIDGQNPLVFQVVPEASRAAESPEGGQLGGGALQRAQAVKIVVWMRVKYDRHQTTEEALTRAAAGMLDIMESVRDLFAMTVLGGIVNEMVRYTGESPTTWYDVDRGVVRRSLTLEVNWRIHLPRAITLDLAAWGSSSSSSSSSSS